MKLAVRLPNAGCYARPETMFRVAEAADELGFWGVSAQDHILASTESTWCHGFHDGEDRTVLEPMQLLAAVGARTRNVRLLTGVLQLPYRHPVLLSKEAATLDAMTGGRLVLGVGVGALYREHQAIEGYILAPNASIAEREWAAFHVTGNRGEIIEEYLAAMDALWTQDTSSFSGRHVSFQHLDPFPKSVQQPRMPIWIGGSSEIAQRRAARIGDGWYPSQCSPAFMAEANVRITETAEEVGRSDAPFDFIVCDAAYIAESDATARRLMKETHGHRFEGDTLWRQTISGSPESFLAQLLEFREAGATAMDLRLLPLSAESMIEQMHLIANEVMPALAAASVTA